MKLYYIERNTMVELIPTPYVWIKYNKLEEKLQVVCIPRYDESMSYPDKSPDVGLISVNKSNIQTKASNSGMEISLSTLTKSVVSEVKRYDREIWMMWCSTRVQNWVTGPVPYYQMGSKGLLNSDLTHLYFDKLEFFSFCSPFADSKWDDCFATVMAADLILTGDPIDLIDSSGFDHAHELRENYLPHIKLTCSDVLTPTKPATLVAEVVDITDTLCGGDMTIYFENVNGQISHNRRKTVNGTTFTRVMVPGMEVGETVRIKAGTKFVTGLAEIELEIKPD